MRSLRRQLLISLSVVVSIVGTVSALIGYLEVNHETKELLDNQLQQVASIVASQIVSVPQSPRSRDDDDIEVAIWNQDGTLQYASSEFMRTPLARTSGFTEKMLGKEPYRIFTTVLEGRIIEVAQQVDTRNDQAEAAALAAFLPVFVLLPILVVVIGFVIRRLLQPVREIAVAVSRRDAFSSEALQGEALPKEILPLVEEINRLLERQREAVQRERHFIADAAHALRTPLTALQLQADVLDGSADLGERVTRFNELRAGIQRARRLTEQLLSLARIESDVDTDNHVVDLDEALAQAYALYEPLATAADVVLQLNAQSRTKVRGDQRRLLLICSNLLDNALRYTPAGGRIDILSGVEGGIVRFEIRDEGPGLQPDQFARVFERFYSAPEDDKPGDGLGLATVESLVKQLGGRVSLLNRTDRSGLIVRVSLPGVSAAVAAA